MLFNSAELAVIQDSCSARISIGKQPTEGKINNYLDSNFIVVLLEQVECLHVGESKSLIMIQCKWFN